MHIKAENEQPKNKHNILEKREKKNPFEMYACAVIELYLLLWFYKELS